MLLFTNDDMRSLLASSLKTAALDQSGWRDSDEGPGSTEGSYINWLTFYDNSKRVFEDVKRIRNHPLVPRRHSDLRLYLRREINSQRFRKPRRLVRRVRRGTYWSRRYRLTADRLPAYNGPSSRIKSLYSETQVHDKGGYRGRPQRNRRYSRNKNAGVWPDRGCSPGITEGPPDVVC